MYLYIICPGQTFTIISVSAGIVYKTSKVTDISVVCLWVKGEGIVGTIDGPIISKGLLNIIVYISWKHWWTEQQDTYWRKYFWNVHFKSIYS